MKEFVTCALTGISVPTDCSSEYCMKCLSCEPAKQYSKAHATMPQLLKAADSRSAAQDAINNREDPAKLNNFEKEINTMNENTYINEDYIIKDKITSTIMNTVCSMAINFNRLPVDLGFKLNNLNATEFKLYAKQLYRHVLDNATPFYEYPDKQAHDKAFYDFRDKNKHLVDDSRTVPVPAPRPEYHIPTDTDIKFKNDAELLALAMQTIEELSKRILTAREAVRNDAELVDTIISQLPKPRKTSVNLWQYDIEESSRSDHYYMLIAEFVLEHTDSDYWSMKVLCNNYITDTDCPDTSFALQVFETVYQDYKDNTGIFDPSNN